MQRQKPHLFKVIKNKALLVNQYTLIPKDERAFQESVEQANKLAEMNLPVEHPIVDESVMDVHLIPTVYERDQISVPRLTYVRHTGDSVIGVKTPHGDVLLEYSDNLYQLLFEESWLYDSGDESLNFETEKHQPSWGGIILSFMLGLAAIIYAISQFYK